MELGCGSFVEMEWLFFFYLFIVESLHIVCPVSVFFCFTLRKSSSARLGQNSRESTSISSITKKPSSSLISCGNCDLSGESMTASKMQC